MSPTAVNAAARSTRFPRVSGDEPNACTIGIECRPFSPREWG